MIPKHRAPTHPGEMLLKEFLEPMGLSQAKLAEELDIPVQRVNTIIRGKRGVSAEAAARAPLRALQGRKAYSAARVMRQRELSTGRLPRVAALRPLSLAMGRLFRVAAMLHKKNPPSYPSTGSGLI